MSGELSNLLLYKTYNYKFSVLERTKFQNRTQCGTECTTTSQTVRRGELFNRKWSISRTIRIVNDSIKRLVKPLPKNYLWSCSEKQIFSP